jgi:hypothetical protein
MHLTELINTNLHSADLRSSDVTAKYWQHIDLTAPTRPTPRPMDRQQQHLRQRHDLAGRVKETWVGQPTHLSDA